MKTFFTRFGKYLLTLLLLILTMGFSEIGEGFMSIPNITVGYLFLFGLPLIALVPKNFFNGLMVFALVTVLVDFISPYIGESLGSISSDTVSSYNKNNVASNSHNGTFSDYSDGITVKILISETKWYGEHVDESTGSVLNSSFGTVLDNKILDAYGSIIGKIKNSKIHVNIGGYDWILHRE